MRGASGASGMLGYNFDIINGRDKPNKHEVLRTRTPKKSRNVYEKEANEADKYGDGVKRLDPVTAKLQVVVSQ